MVWSCLDLAQWVWPAWSDGLWPMVTYYRGSMISYFPCHFQRLVVEDPRVTGSSQLHPNWRFSICCCELRSWGLDSLHRFCCLALAVGGRLPYWSPNRILVGLPRLAVPNYYSRPAGLYSRLVPLNFNWKNGKRIDLLERSQIILPFLWLRSNK